MKYESPDYESRSPKKNFGSWRVQSSESSKSGDEFDELVVRLGENQNIHLEVMNEDYMFIDIAGCCFHLTQKHGIWFLGFFETRDAVLLVDETATEMAFGRISPTRDDTARVKRALAALRKGQITNNRRVKKGLPSIPLPLTPIRKTKKTKAKS